MHWSAWKAASTRRDWDLLSFPLFPACPAQRQVKFLVVRMSRHFLAIKVNSESGSIRDTDTGLRTVFAFDMNQYGELTGKRVFLSFEKQWGYPDGMAADAEGGLWIAHWDGGRISRFRPDGSLDRSISVPASNVTSVVFAGPQLDRMFVTSAAFGCETEPLAGALFEVNPGVRGHSVQAFAG